MRFVIDAANETTMVQEVGVTNDGKTYVNCHYVTDLDELTPDYIRKHFGQMLADFYLGLPGDEDAVLLWSAEEEYPKATPEMEREHLYQHIFR